MFRKQNHSNKRPETTRNPAQNFAGRVGQWSANHWKTAVLAWLVFVVGAVMAGSVIGTKLIDQNEANVGESRNGDRILREAGFTVDKNGESVEAQLLDHGSSKKAARRRPAQSGGVVFASCQGICRTPAESSTIPATPRRRHRRGACSRARRSATRPPGPRRMPPTRRP